MLHVPSQKVAKGPADVPSDSACSPSVRKATVRFGSVPNQVGSSSNGSVTIASSAGSSSAGSKFGRDCLGRTLGEVFFENTSARNNHGNTQTNTTKKSASDTFGAIRSFENLQSREETHVFLSTGNFRKKMCFSLDCKFS